MMFHACVCRGHTDAVLCVQFDKEKVVSGSKDTTIKVLCVQPFDCLFMCYMYVAST